MPLNGASVLSGTTVSASGGTALTFSSAGVDNGKVILYCDDDTDLRTRREFVCTAKPPRISASAPNGYTQARVTVTFKSPLELDNGNVTVNSGKFELAFDPETTEAEISEILDVVAQSIVDSDFTNLYHDLSLS
jgi:hypothetical protein